MASLLASRGVFAARTAAPVRSIMAARAPVAAVAMPLRTSQSAFLGGSFAGATMQRSPVSRGGLVVMANNKKSMACTKEGTNRKRRRVSGFRARMATPNGRKVLKARRAKGRHSLCPASEGKSGGKK